ncbi:MAG: hypothetical protein JRG80_15070 [Deltaproteobacteria bacterium]|nr:hypothetical protein [Deltaproteobacteria bacterium]
MNVDDGIGCTDDSCDEVGDVVVNTPVNANCDDGDVCNGAEICHVTFDCQSKQPLNCDDADPCTADSCDQVLGCAHDPIPMCGAAVPSASPGGRMLVGLLLMSAGAVFLGQRRRQRS